MQHAILAVGPHGVLTQEEHVKNIDNSTNLESGQKQVTLGNFMTLLSQFVEAERCGTCRCSLLALVDWTFTLWLAGPVKCLASPCLAPTRKPHQSSLHTLSLC